MKLKILKYLDYLSRIITFLLRMLPVIFITHILNLFYNYKRKDIWLIAERKDESRDNGYHLFKYIRENYPEKKVYYVINEDAADRKKLVQYKNLINYGSWKHYFYYSICTKSISTHVHGAAPNGVACLLLYGIMPVRKKTVYLNHGVNKDFYPSHMRKKTKIDLYITSAIPEYKFMLESYDYDKSQLKCCGLCRFDQLHDYKSKNVILIMPTFRSWLHNLSRLPRLEAKKEFMKDDYYVKYQSLINNKDLIDYLNKNNLKLIFYPHHAAQKFLDCFTTMSKNIIIANKNVYDVQQLLKDSKLLITDFSSVFLILLI